MSLEGRTAVITGASRGIGAAVARVLHDRGCNLVVFALERPRHLRMLETALWPMSEASWG
jgi:NAD(P)-dependent dehydrogenase (short-subunit alcohol dehydrogenase family)